MPDAALEWTVSSASGRWERGEGTGGEALRLAGPARLRLTSEGVAIDAAHGASLRIRFDELEGGAWRTGVLTLHGPDGSVTVEAARGLDQAWVALIARACPMPELTRAHRHLGSRRGGPAAAQARFLAPLLQARRLLEDEGDPDVRVALFDARAIRERLEAALHGIAGDAWPESDPDRRALEAELEQSVAGLFAKLAAVDEAARHFRDAEEPVRFKAWRTWVAAVGAVYASADAEWAAASRLIPHRNGRTS